MSAPKARHVTPNFNSSGNGREWLRDLHGCRIPKNRDKRLSLENFAGFDYNYVI